MKLNARIFAALAVLLASLSVYADSRIPIKIGLLHSFSKASSTCYDPYGRYLERGVRMAWDDYALSNPKRRFDIVFKKYDYDDNKLKAMEVVDEAVGDNMMAAIGFICSDYALLGGRRAEEVGLPVVTPTSSHNDVSRIGDYVYTVMYTDDYQGQELAMFAHDELRLRKTIAIVAADCAYCQSLYKAYSTKFENKGGSIPKKYDILTSDTMFDDVMSDILKYKYDSILLPNYAMQSALIIAECLKHNITPVFLGGDGWNWTENMFEIIGDRKMNAYSVTSWVREIENPRSKKFVKEYEQKYSEEAIATAAHSYDAAMLLFRSIENTKTYSRGGIKDSLKTVDRIDGVTGRSSYTGNHSPRKSLVVLKMGSGRQNILKTVNPK